MIPSSSFDWVVAIRVREVWTEAAVTLPRIRDWLRPDGRVCLVIDAPSDARLATMVDQATTALRAHGFSDPERRLQPADRLAVVTARLLDAFDGCRCRRARSTF